MISFDERLKEKAKERTEHLVDKLKYVSDLWYPRNDDMMQIHDIQLKGKNNRQRAWHIIWRYGSKFVHGAHIMERVTFEGRQLGKSYWSINKSEISNMLYLLVQVVDISIIDECITHLMKRLEKYHKTGKKN